MGWHSRVPDSPGDPGSWFDSSPSHVTEPTRRWVSTGQRVEVDASGGRLDRIPPYNPKTQEHLWIWTVAYRARPELLGDPTHTPILDQETMLTTPGLGCWYCEQPYEPRMVHRRCPGEPR